MAFLRSYEGPNSEEFDDNYSYNRSCSLSWTSSGPSEEEVPMPGLCSSSSEQATGQTEQRNTGNQAPPLTRQCKNPLPSSGSRRDSSGNWSVGSEGHDQGRCQGPCKDVRSGRGCTFGRKCKRCHCPHPEVSSTSIRSKKSRAKKMAESYVTQESGQNRNSSVDGQADTRTDEMSQESPSGFITISL
eukprot:TRINITY_DN5394_c0_g1_i1.p1 TRINITY_DN5394_c0_g1~~TRINITY_DN5394_c0_g1_i1.p1  ORF type:complete len:187 (+),score=2.90 TRINITY_DN5394_c0_g1_i1:154-714(+)